MKIFYDPIRAVSEAKGTALLDAARMLRNLIKKQKS
jgi:hypothetical protein